MHLEADDGLPGHQRTSSAAADDPLERAGRREHPLVLEERRDELRADRQALAPPDRQAQRRQPGQADGADEDVRQVHRHRIRGLLAGPERRGRRGRREQEIDAAGEGAPEVVGDQRPDLLRLPVVGVVVAGAQHVGADQDPALHLGAEPLAARGPVERPDVAAGPDLPRAVAHAVVPGQVGRRLGRRDDVVGRHRVAASAGATPRPARRRARGWRPWRAPCPRATPGIEIRREVLARAGRSGGP